MISDFLSNLAFLAKMSLASGNAIPVVVSSAEVDEEDLVAPPDAGDFYRADPGFWAYRKVPNRYTRDLVDWESAVAFGLVGQ